MRTSPLRAGFAAVALVLLLAAAAGLALGSKATPSITSGTTAVNGAADQAAAVPAADFEAALAAAGFSVDELNPEPEPAIGFGRGFNLKRGFGLWGFGGSIVHVEGVVSTKSKGFVTFALDHGKATGASDTSLTIAEANGASVPVTLNADTKVWLRGVKSAKGSAIPKDAEVYVLSQKAGSGWLATRIFVIQPRVPKPSGSAKPAATPPTAPTQPSSPATPSGPTPTPSQAATPSATASPTAEPTPTPTSSGSGASG